MLSAGFAETGAGGESLQRRCWKRPGRSPCASSDRTVLAFLRPHRASTLVFAHDAKAGDTAFFTQSGAMLTAVVDWAAARGIGFSQLVSLGGMADVDFGDLLDARSDPKTHAVLLYIESITHARKFMSAARRCARIKPVIVVKSGRHDESARAARSHTGALAGSDAVYDAAFRRAGMLRVSTIEDLFDTLEIVSHGVRSDRKPFRHRDEWRRGRRVGNRSPHRAGRPLGGVHTANTGPIERKPAAQLERRQSGRHHRRCRCRALSRKRRSGAFRSGVDAVIVINCPVAVTNSAKAADAVISVVRSTKAQTSIKPVLASWLGERAVAAPESASTKKASRIIPRPKRQ